MTKLNCLKCGNKTKSNPCETCGFDIQKESFNLLDHNTISLIRVPSKVKSRAKNRAEFPDPRIALFDYEDSFETGHPFPKNELVDTHKNTSDESKAKIHPKKFIVIGVSLVLVISILSFLLVYFNNVKKYANNEIAEGNIIKLGRYEQDGNTKNGLEPIEWKVSTVSFDGESASLDCCNCLDILNYTDDKNDNMWKSSKLRLWLNSVFFNTAFNEEEQEIFELCSDPTNHLYAENDDTQNVIKNEYTSDNVTINEISIVNKYLKFPAISKYAEGKWDEKHKYNPIIWVRNPLRSENVLAYQRSGDSNEGSYIWDLDMTDEAFILPHITININKYYSLVNKDSGNVSTDISSNTGSEKETDNKSKIESTTQKSTERKGEQIVGETPKIGDIIYISPQISSTALYNSPSEDDWTFAVLTPCWVKVLSTSIVEGVVWLQIETVEYVQINTDDEKRKGWIVQPDVYLREPAE